MHVQCLHLEVTTHVHALCTEMAQPWVENTFISLAWALHSERFRAALNKFLLSGMLCSDVYTPSHGPRYSCRVKLPCGCRTPY